MIHEDTACLAKRARTRADLKQRDFAKAIGASLRVVYEWEAGEKRPRGPALILLRIIAEGLVPIHRIQEMDADG